MSQPAAAFLTVFVTVFLAELGDKTQLATLLYATGGRSPWLVFAAAAAALVTATAIAVVVGTAGARWIEGVPLKLIAGLGFIAIGVWTVVQHFRG
jgi:putative Ca2+/H+ antiporter (TMEM165/GDT1 family)